ncbi:AMP-dependent synthetase/ligase [Mobiluncus mulieris]|uniref:AMP-dependent synthetase/ligase n=1 Tax=Mobiluncus mulieris TaxID=2052 RepID=UPI00019F938B|nr:AMP-dependent synthetase/ligase [Mobiluncus mulieris]EEJ54658.1 AMP-binding enzyme [Mobiluncus mulieris ATCC 35243]EFN92312.1 AMP-binding enzyme [Mobiluncus mulieris FB024-16]MCV0009671.1 long-chain fatty acid--CoA ligase [Mobiluncus mulieris]NMX01587.1 long-chain fatty acid--CoA ligase [Mobiluncus mulieris]NMX20224.1 long-chain fatty acid--CoA ligase [Mobiluncus mulieris]
MAETETFQSPVKVTVLPDGTMEAFNPSTVKIPYSWNIVRLLLNRVKRNPDATLIERKVGLGYEWQPITAKQFLDEVDSVARGLMALGLRSGDRMAVMAHTSFEWTLLDYACWSVGAVNVPLYETSSLAQIGTVLQEADIKIAFAENARLAEAINTAAQQVKHPCQVLSLDLGAIAALHEAGNMVAQIQVDTARKALTMDSPATIIYTSGTSGKPKGTVLTHGNFTTLVWGNMGWMPEFSRDPRSRLLLFLPLAHVYARLLEVFMISGAGVLGHAPNIKNLLPDIASFKPTYLLVVPRVLEKIYNSADAQASASKVKHLLFKRAVRTAIDYSRALDYPEPVSKRLRARRAFYEQLVYRKIMGLLGGKCGFVISGGGALGDRLGHFYRGIGLQVLEGYGLTETTAPVTVNTMKLNRIGTVGAPVCSATIRVTPEGEIWIKGPTVSPGYLKPEQNDGVFHDDGWFDSGDLGSMNEAGLLTITGRAKEMLVTAGGKNVVPATLEGPLQSHPLISQIMIVGEGKPFVGALVTLDAEMLPGWMKNKGLEPVDVTAASHHPAIEASIARAIDKANQGVSRAESIREFRILPFDFTEANGMLTPSMKIRRSVIAQKCATEIEDIYKDVAQPELDEKPGGMMANGRADLSKITGYLKNLLSFPHGE